MPKGYRKDGAKIIPPSRFGRHLSHETRSKISAANTGKKHSNDSRKKMSESRMGISPWNKGKKLQPHTEEHKKLMSRIAKEKGFGKWMKGRMPSNIETLRQGMHGEDHPNWKGGITPENEKIRHSDEYKLWRKSIFGLYDFRCIDCGERGGDLEADHIFRFADYPRLRFEILNGQLLCRKCHRKKTSYEMTGIYSL